MKLVIRNCCVRTLIILKKADALQLQWDGLKQEAAGFSRSDISTSFSGKRNPELGQRLLTSWCSAVMEVQTRTGRAHKHVGKPQPKSLVPLRLFSKSYAADLYWTIPNA
jgi:hypothetical protein